MPSPSRSDVSPWPLQTPPPSQSRKRKILSPPENRSLYIRRQIADQSTVETQLAVCNEVGNGVTSCYPTADTLVSQHQWASFIWNSRLPEFTQFNLVNIYLFHADSRQLVLSVMNETNPVGRSGQITQQVDDTWFQNGGVDWHGSNISYPFFWVITRSDKTLDGTEVPQATFSAVQTTYADSVMSSMASSSSVAALSASSLSAASASATRAVASSSTQSPGSLQSNSQSAFPHWGIAVIVVLGFFAILAVCVLAFLLVHRARRTRSAGTSHRGSIGSASPMISGAGGAPQSPLMTEQTRAPRPASMYSPNDGSSMNSHAHSTETPFSGADAAIMADAFRKALRKPDFAGRTIEEGDSPEADEQKEHQLLSRELAEEGRDIRSVDSSRDVRVETLSDAGDKGKDAPR